MFVNVVVWLKVYKMGDLATKGMTDKCKVTDVTMRKEGMGADELMTHDKVEGLTGGGGEGGEDV